jgi:hypothetical protein
MVTTIAGQFVHQMLCAVPRVPYQCRTYADTGIYIYLRSLASSERQMLVSRDTRGTCAKCLIYCTQRHTYADAGTLHNTDAGAAPYLRGYRDPSSAGQFCSPVHRHTQPCCPGSRLHQIRTCRIPAASVQPPQLQVQKSL